MGLPQFKQSFACSIEANLGQKLISWTIERCRSLHDSFFSPGPASSARSAFVFRVVSTATATRALSASASPAGAACSAISVSSVQGF